MEEDMRRALLSVIPVVIGVLATGGLGAGLGFWWNLLLKKREADLATVKAFHELYGEFFAVWKLWDYYVINTRTAEFPNEIRWKLLERACAAEGKMEAILIDLSSKYHSSSTSLNTLGQFRQVYQQLRESIRDNRALAWDNADHPIYTYFKKLAPVIAYMTRMGHVGHLAHTEQAGAWLDVTHNRHENFWDHT